MMESNLDRVSAQIGFIACDIYMCLSLVLNEKKEEIKQLKLEEFESKKDTLISEIKKRTNITDTEIIERIVDVIVFDRMKRDKNPNKAFEEFKKNLPKFDAKEIERIITKSLGILIEDGLFAYAIWLESENKDPHKVITVSSLKILTDTNLISNKKSNLRDAMLEISSSIQKTLLTRQLLERMLIYARYRAKALQKGSD